eukprot:gene4136-4460_t
MRAHVNVVLSGSTVTRDVRGMESDAERPRRTERDAEHLQSVFDPGEKHLHHTWSEKNSLSLLDTGVLAAPEVSTTPPHVPGPPPCPGGHSVLLVDHASGLVDARFHLCPGPAEGALGALGPDLSSSPLGDGGAVAAGTAVAGRLSLAPLNGTRLRRLPPGGLACGPGSSGHAASPTPAHQARPVMGSGPAGAASTHLPGEQHPLSPGACCACPPAPAGTPVDGPSIDRAGPIEPGCAPCGPLPPAIMQMHTHMDPGGIPISLSKCQCNAALPTHLVWPPKASGPASGTPTAAPGGTATSTCSGPACLIGPAPAAPVLPTPGAPSLSAAAPGLGRARSLQAGAPDPESQALEDLYQSTNGSGWGKNDGWMGSGQPCCDPPDPGKHQGCWDGVVCDGDRITILGLPSNQLGGRIPEALTKLKQLTKLFLNNNLLTGTIPEGLAELDQLTD